MGLFLPAMVTSPTGKGVIAMGGSTESGEYSKAMFELSASMQWTRLEQTLKIGHLVPLAIPIPDELVGEKNESKNKRRKLKRVAQSKMSREMSYMSQDNILTSKRRRKN